MKRHGETKFSWSDDLFIVEPLGPFNEEGQEYANEEIKKAILNKGLKRWRRLEILDVETMGSLSVLDIVKKMYEWYEENGCYTTAVVVRNSVQTYTIEQVFQSNAVKVFIDVDDAREWINVQ